MVKCRVNRGPLPEGLTVAIFQVVNTAFKHIYVIAEDEKSAMGVAWAANHVHGNHEIHEDYYFRAAHKVNLDKDKNLQKFSVALELAMDRRLVGTLHFDDDRVWVGEEVIG